MENYIFSILWLNKIFSNSWKSIPDNKYLGHILLKIAPATMKWKNYIFFQKMVSQSSRGFHHMENRNRIPIYGYSFAQAKSGSADEVRASVAKL